jgi:hypothetical protein
MDGMNKTDEGNIQHSTFNAQRPTSKKRQKAALLTPNGLPSRKNYAEWVMVEVIGRILGN